MTDARLELAPDRTVAPPWARRFATLGVFLANGARNWRLGSRHSPGQGGPRAFRCSAELCASGFCGRRDHGDAAHGSFRPSFAERTGVGHLRFRFRRRYSRRLVSPGRWRRLCATTFLAGRRCGVMDVAMNANASDIERRWGKPIMSSFHAAIQLRGRERARCWAGGLGSWERSWGLVGPALLSSLIVAISGSDSSCGQGHGFGGAWICGAQPAPLAAGGAGVRIDGDGRLGRRLERNLSRALGRGGGRDRRRLRGLFASDDHRQACRRSDRRRCGNARDGWPWRSHRRGGARDQRHLARACRRRRRLRTGRRGPRQCRAGPLQRRRADRGHRRRSGRFGRDLGLCGSLIGPVVIGAVASAVDLRSTIVMLAGVALSRRRSLRREREALRAGGEGAGFKTPSARRNNRRPIGRRCPHR